VGYIKFLDDAPVSLVEVYDPEFVELGYARYFFNEEVV
jgi:hypothetical protein